MAEPHWTSYVGMGSGLIGSITDISGAIMGYISYRRSNKLKSMDLRLELCKAVSDIHTDSKRLIELMATTSAARQVLWRKRGLQKTPAMKQFTNKVVVDKKKIAKIRESISEDRSVYDKLNIKDLESWLVSVHKFKSEIQNLIDKYSDFSRSDKKECEQIRADHRAMLDRIPDR